MMITVLAPTHRPWALPNILDNFHRQDFPDKRLIVIENGDAVGSCDRFTASPDVLLRSGHDKSEALNEALQWLRSHGGGPWAIMDDDDYYGPGYLAEADALLPNADIIGKPSVFVRRCDGHLWLFMRNGRPFGHSLAGHSGCLDFESCGRWGEDERWFRLMTEAGASYVESSHWHFVWNRGSHDHAWTATDNQLAQALDRTGGIRILDYGPLKDLSFVNQGAPEPDWKPIELPPFDFIRDGVGIPPEVAERWQEFT